MFLKIKYVLLVFISLISCSFSQEKRLELVIDEKLTLEDVFAAGFRPSSVHTSNDGDVRVWERQKVTLVFGDFRYDVNTEQTTFSLYDDNQISKLHIIATREKPLSVDEASAGVRKLFSGLHYDAEADIKKWHEKCRLRSSMAMESFGGIEWRKGVRVSGEFLTTLQPLDRYPAILAFEIHWDYLGKGPAGGDRWGVKNVSPPGYDWDISYESFHQRMLEEKAGNRETNVPKERLGIMLQEDLSQNKAINSKHNISGDIKTREGSPVRHQNWLIHILGAMFTVILIIFLGVKLRRL